MRWSGVRCAEGAALTLQQAGPHWALTPPLGRRPAAQKPGERSCGPGESHARAEGFQPPLPVRTEKSRLHACNIKPWMWPWRRIVLLP